MSILNQLTQRFSRLITGSFFTGRMIDLPTGKRMSLPQSGFVFITGRSGSGKSKLMQEIIRKQSQVDYAAYGIALDYRINQKNFNQRFAVTALHDPIDWFDLRSKLSEDLSQGSDIIFDDAEIYVNDNSIGILKPVFTSEMRNRVFFVTQQSCALLKQQAHPLSIFGGSEIRL